MCKSTFVHSGIRISYHIGGSHEPALILLPGAIGNGEAFFLHMLELAQRYTVISFYYGEAASMDQIAAGVLAVVLRYHGAAHLEIRQGGHLSLITDMDLYVERIIRFMDGEGTVTDA
ncbi:MULTISPECIES: alpha/beta fold hydrolase [Paenibacillus]|uniref:Alpha/beta hydrolase n=1 Tax=Paenibacillus campinasensis TaxID=66347 RepID=A0A268EV80_9BACL|nr:hypothetical protein [Paenibacillus campinasensis]PAD77001.1 hypothetical protein CHH67_10800 [Paenibacillus campinasensis]